MIIKTGGPAFPHGAPGSFGSSGMSLRDYFAAAALAAMPPFLPTSSTDDHLVPAEKIAARCYAIADALIAEANRAKGGEVP